ncbi:sensor histidine kinase [Streptomyces sp. NPDC101194]|uniref:sensor histidine kinase n=1 Tax=Streptomyces sp. NPDC101194 TaxID=3366127 RepID=UPI00380F1AB8
MTTFGTLALLDACVYSGLLTPEEHLVVKAELLRNYFVDIPFSAELYRVAAQTDGWQAKAVAVAVSRPTAWSDAQAASAFALEAASRVIDSLPHEASDWLSAAYAGLHRATLPSHRRRNLQVLIWQILTQPWVTASSLPFVLTGLRTGRDSVADSDEAGLELTPQPSVKDLPVLADRVRATGTPVALDLSEDAESMSPGLQLAAYRIVQEAVTNALKYAAEGAPLSIAVRRTADSVDITVTDAGPKSGARRTAPATGGGHGLIGMKERAALFSGQVNAGPAPGGGWTLLATLHDAPHQPDDESEPS